MREGLIRNEESGSATSARRGRTGAHAARKLMRIGAFEALKAQALEPFMGLVERCDRSRCRISRGSRTFSSAVRQEEADRTEKYCPDASKLGEVVGRILPEHRDAASGRSLKPSSRLRRRLAAPRAAQTHVYSPCAIAKVKCSSALMVRSPCQKSLSTSSKRIAGAPHRLRSWGTRRSALSVHEVPLERGEHLIKDQHEDHEHHVHAMALSIRNCSCAARS